MLANKTLKYLELSNWILNRIKSGEYNSGMKLPSEYELSTKFGVSRQTVRRAISNLEHDGLVQSRQGSGNYICDLASSRKSTMIIALIITYVDSYIFPNIIQGIEKVASNYNYSVQISFTNNDVEKEASILKKLIEKDTVDGIIVEANRSNLPNPNLSLYQKILSKQIPIIFLNTYYPELNAPHVCLNDVEAGYVITKYLIGLGHSNIAGIFKLDDGQGGKRYKGYVQALRESNIQIRHERILWYDTEDLEYFEQYNKSLVHRIQGCTACVCYNDMIAINLLDICKNNNIQVPQQFSVVGIDNCEAYQHMNLGLTTINHPSMEMGEKAAHNLILMIKHINFEPAYEFPAVLIERTSTIKL